MLDEQNLTFNNDNNTEVLKLDSLVEISDNLRKDIHKAFISSFIGIPVRIDPELDGYSYYISISQELHNELEAKNDTVKIGK